MPNSTSAGGRPRSITNVILAGLICLILGVGIGVLAATPRTNPPPPAILGGDNRVDSVKAEVTDVAKRVTDLENKVLQLTVINHTLDMDKKRRELMLSKLTPAKGTGEPEQIPPPKVPVPKP